MTCGKLVLTLIALLTAAACAWPQGLLTNCGFEEAEGARPAGWNLAGGAEWVADPAIAHSGQRCVKGRFDDGIGQRLAVEGGAAYRISGWIRRVDPAGTEVPKIKVYFLDPQGNEVDVQATEFPGVTGDWSPWETVMQAPFDAAVMNLTLRGFFTGSEWFYWDDLAVQEVEAPDWPAWDATPNLDGMTVTVPDIADVWTDALLRWPSQAQIPIDGQLDSSALLRGEAVRVELARPAWLSWALIHTMRPTMNLGAATLRALSPTPRPLAESQPKQELVTSLRFDDTEADRALLEIPRDAQVYLNEIQLFGLGERVELPGERVESALTEGAPDAMADDLAAAWAAEGQRASLMATDGAGTGTTTLGGNQYVSVFLAPRDAEYGVTGLSLDLALPGAGEGAMIEITLKRPAELDANVSYVTLSDRGVSTGKYPPRNYATVFRAVSRVEGGRLASSFDVPDLLFAAGEPVWLTLRAKREMTLDLSATRIAMHVVEPAAVLAEYVPQLERLTRRLYSEASEAHAYDGRDWAAMILGRYVKRVLALDPDNLPATYIYRRIAHVREEIELTRPGPADAPEWAVWAREALRGRHEIITWWLDHRQQANGELGGHINDDGEFSCNWPSHYLITGDERVADGLRKLADVAWEMSGGTGYTVGSRDVEHAAEDQSCTQPQVLLVDYGSPRAVERFMVMSRYFDLWTHINEAGRRQFRSFMFNTQQVWDDPPFDVDQPYCPLAMVGAGHLIWYTLSPQVEEIFLQEAESWALACLSTDKGKAEGKIPMEIHARTSEIDPYAPYPNNPILQQRNELYRGGAGAYIVQYLLRGAFALTNADPFARVVSLWETSDADKLAAAQANLQRFTTPIPPPPDGPEKRFTVPASAAADVVAPFRPVRDGEAIGTGAQEDGGSATFTINVPQAGRYAVWALLGRTDPTEEGTQQSTFFVYVDDRPMDRIRAAGPANAWTPALGPAIYELRAGAHTIRVEERYPGSALREIGFTNQYSLEGMWNPSQGETSLYQAWRVAGDRTWLVEELKEVVRQQMRNRWLLTEAEPFTDRIPVPGTDLLSRLYLGEWTSGKSHLPGHWVSWEGGGLDYAAAVLDARPDHLKALVYSFHDQPTPMTMRVWRLPHGRYRVRMGVDSDGDDEPDAQVTAGEQELWRYDGALPFTAHPGQTVVIELTLLEELADIRERPDLAIDPQDVTREGDTLSVTVHNIGGSAAPASVLQVLGEAGEIATAQVPALQAPHDLQPKTATVRIDLPAGARPTAVLLDSPGAIDEITEANNRVSGWD
ncbi:MAG: hypothetical protein AB7Y46_09705 [Armatimonadota bacterium]